MTTANNNFVFIQNATITYARFVTPKMRFGKPAWEVTVQLTKTEAKKAHKAGLTVKSDDGKYFVSIHKEAKQGARPPTVVGRNLEPVEDAKLVGPGSKINIKVNTFKYTWAAQTGTGYRLMAVQVIKQVAPITNSVTSGFVAQ